jgi:hypothetical protein
VQFISFVTWTWLYSAIVNYLSKLWSY